MGISERSYVQAEPPQTLPPVPVRVSRKSQLMAALRQHARPIVIEDPYLGRPFSRDVSEIIAAKVRNVAEHEDHEATSGALLSIEKHIGRVSQRALRGRAWR